MLRRPEPGCVHPPFLRPRVVAGPKRSSLLQRADRRAVRIEESQRRKRRSVRLRANLRVHAKRSFRVAIRGSAADRQWRRGLQRDVVPQAAKGRQHVRNEAGQHLAERIGVVRIVTGLCHHDRQLVFALPQRVAGIHPEAVPESLVSAQRNIVERNLAGIANAAEEQLRRLSLLQTERPAIARRPRLVPSPQSPVKAARHRYRPHLAVRHARFPFAVQIQSQARPPFCTRVYFILRALYHAARGCINHLCPPTKTRRPERRRSNRRAKTGFQHRLLHVSFS